MIPFALKGLWDFIPKAVFAALAVALGCFLIAASIQNAGLKGKIRRAEITIGNLQVDLRQCQANRITLTDALGRQNAAVAAMRDADAQQAADAAKAVSEARRAADDANRRMAAIMRARPGADRCASADALILETIR